MLFAMNASKLKKHAPDAHTFLEVIGARWGLAAHLTFMFFGLLTNLIGKKKSPGVCAHTPTYFFQISLLPHLPPSPLIPSHHIVSSMLILGGSAAVTDLTGMPTLAACYLIPLSVCFYVFVGGIRAALFCDYIHTTILLIFILVFLFSAYATSDKIGSPSAMYRLLEEAATRSPVAGNAQGSYMTMRSVDGLIFGVINVSGWRTNTERT